MMVMFDGGDDELEGVLSCLFGDDDDDGDVGFVGDSADDNPMWRKAKKFTTDTSGVRESDFPFRCERNKRPHFRKA